MSRVGRRVWKRGAFTEAVETAPLTESLKQAALPSFVFGLERSTRWKPNERLSTIQWYLEIGRQLKAPKEVVDAVIHWLQSEGYEG
jgi:hypothetical protein